MGRISGLGRSSVVYGIGTVLSRFVTLLLLPLFTAHLTPADYGVIAQLTLLFMIVQAVFSFGLGNVVGPVYAGFDGPRERSQTVWTAFLVLLAGSGAMLIMAWAVPEAVSVLAVQSADRSDLVTITLIGCAVNTLAIPFSQKIQFENRAKTHVAVTLATAVVSIALSMLTVVYWGMGAMGMALSQLASYVVHLALFAVAGARNTRPLFDAEIARRLIRLGIPFVPGFAFQIVLLQGNRYILGLFHGMEAVGVYSVGFSIGATMSLGVMALTTAWQPYFMNFAERKHEIRELFGRIFTYYVLVFGFLCVAFFAFASPVISLMTQPPFHDAHLVVGFSACAYFFIGMFHMFLPGAYYTGELKYISLIQACAMAAFLVVSFPLIWAFGSVGAGAALAIGHFLMAAFQYFFNRNRKGRYPKIDYEWGRVVKVLAAFGLISAMSFLWQGRSAAAGIAYGIGMIALASAVVYSVLNDGERALLWKGAGRFMRGQHG